MVLFGAVRAKPVRPIAHILFGLTHRASSVETSTPNARVADSTTDSQIRAIAEAVANVRHTTRAGDRSSLQAPIDEDASVPTSLETLATTVGSVRHVSTPADKAEFQKLVE